MIHVSIHLSEITKFCFSHTAVLVSVVPGEESQHQEMLLMLLSSSTNGDAHVGQGRHFGSWGQTHGPVEEDASAPVESIPDPGAPSMFKQMP